jgi:hypothetical protein
MSPSLSPSICFDLQFTVNVPGRTCPFFFSAIIEDIGALHSVDTVSLMVSVRVIVEGQVAGKPPGILTMRGLSSVSMPAVSGTLLRDYVK